MHTIKIFSFFYCLLALWKVARQLNKEKKNWVLFILFSNSIDPSLLKTYDYQNVQYVCEGNEKSLEKCQIKKVDKWVFQTNCHAEDRVYITCSAEKENDIIESKSKQSVSWKFFLFWVYTVSVL